MNNNAPLEKNIPPEFDKNKIYVKIVTSKNS